MTDDTYTLELDVEPYVLAEDPADFDFGAEESTPEESAPADVVAIDSDVDTDPAGVLDEAAPEEAEDFPLDEALPDSAVAVEDPGTWYYDAGGWAFEPLNLLSLALAAATHEAA